MSDVLNLTVEKFKSSAVDKNIDGVLVAGVDAERETVCAQIGMLTNSDLFAIMVVLLKDEDVDAPFILRHLIAEFGLWGESSTH